MAASSSFSPETRADAVLAPGMRRADGAGSELGVEVMARPYQSVGMIVKPPLGRPAIAALWKKPPRGYAPAADFYGGGGPLASPRSVYASAEDMRHGRPGREACGTRGRR